MSEYIIGVVGLAGAGKSTIADRLVADYGYENIAFADKLKEILGLAFDAPRGLFYDPALKEVSTPLMSRNRLLQRFKTFNDLVNFLNPILADLYDRKQDDIRNDDIDYFVAKFFLDLTPEHESTPRHVMQQIATEGFRHLDPKTWTNYLIRKVFAHPDKRYAISDVRFPDEAEMVQLAGGMIFYVKRDVAKQNHASEAHIANIGKDADVILVNDRKIDDLYGQLDKTMAACNIQAISNKKTTRAPR